MSENNHIYKHQNTARLSEEELTYIDENYEEIAGTPDKISFSKFFMKAVTAAVTSIKPKTKEIVKEVDNPELLAKIKELQDVNEALQQQCEAYKNKIPPKSAIILNFDKPEMRKYMWGVLQVSKKMKYANSYEELLTKIFEVLHARGEMTLSKEDVEYLNTLKYDLDE